MKKIFLGLVFVLFAFQVNAATISWDFSATNTGTGTKLAGDFDAPSTSEIKAVSSFTSLTGAQNLNFNFDVSGGPASVGGLVIEFVNDDFTINPGSITLKTISGTVTNKVFSDAGILFGVQGWELSPAVELGTGSYFIDIALASVDSTTGKLNVQLTTSAVPIPAAVWLFGSALMGLVGVSRRKSTAVAA